MTLPPRATRGRARSPLVTRLGIAASPGSRGPLPPLTAGPVPRRARDRITISDRRRSALGAHRAAAIHARSGLRLPGGARADQALGRLSPGRPEGSIADD